jgi:hypothetical protein
MMPIVYDELRRLGRSSLRHAPDRSLLQPTALVHEAWSRIAGKDQLSFASRGQFYALAAKVMRDILVDALQRPAAERHAFATTITDPELRSQVTSLLAAADESAR